MTLLGVQDEGLDVSVSIRSHANPESASKNKLQPYLVEKILPNGKILCVEPISRHHAPDLSQLSFSSHGRQGQGAFLSCGHDAYL